MTFIYIYFWSEVEAKWHYTCMSLTLGTKLVTSNSNVTRS